MRFRSCVLMLLVGCAADPADNDELTANEQAVTGSDTLEEYAAKCDAATGLHVPEFTCDDGVSPGGQDIHDGKCASPNVLNHRCDPGAKFQVLVENADASVVAHCRKLGHGAGKFGDIAIIQYNKRNGATCFYQALGDLPGANVKPPSAGVAAWFWQTPSKTRSQQCTGCHDNGAFIRSPYLAQLTSGQEVLPSVTQGYNNLDTPVRWVGLDFANERSWSVTRTDEGTCTSCHRLAVSNWGKGIGTATRYGLEATAASGDMDYGHAQKFDHGVPTAQDPYRSPIWMMKGQNVFSQASFDAAKRIAACGEAFLSSGVAGANCAVTLLGQAYTQSIPNGGDDIAVLGSSTEGAGLTVGFSNGDGSFAVTNTTVGWFATAAKGAGVHRVSGDFNKDGRMDFALVGGQGWNTIPVAFSNGDGTFTLTNLGAGPDFNAWARTPGAKPYVGDFNKDGYSDIALAGASGWMSIPIAFAAGGGAWQITNAFAGAFPAMTAIAGVKVFVGDFNKDGFSDLTVVGNTASSQIPVAFAAGGGAWQITQFSVPGFNQNAAGAHVTTLVGDFNKDGYSDLALTGAVGWQSIPVAFAAGGGAWQFTNLPAADFAAHASNTGAKPLVGDFNKDGYADIALTGVAGWASIPIAFAAGGGSWHTTNNAVGWDFGAWASTPGARPYVGDFNNDGYSDIALTGASWWGSIPVAFSTGGGNWSVTNAETMWLPKVTVDGSATAAVGRVN